MPYSRFREGSSASVYGSLLETRRYNGHGVRMKALLLLSLLAATPALADDAPSPRAVVEAKFAAVNRHSVPDVVAFYAPDARVTASDFCKPRQGRADVERTYTNIFASVPDVAVSVDETVAQDDRVAVRFTLRGSVSGKSFAVPIQDFFTVHDGLIVRDDGMFDNHGRPCNP